MHHFLLVILAASLVSISACSQVTPKPNVVSHASASGALRCDVPWPSPDLSIVDDVGEGYESIAFVIKNGSIHTIERFAKVNHSWTQVPKAVPGAKRLAHLEKIYIAQFWVPRFDVVDELAAEERFLGKGIAGRFIVLKAELSGVSQHFGVLLIERPDAQYILQYTHPLLWREDMIISALANFFGKCEI